MQSIEWTIQGILRDYVQVSSSLSMPSFPQSVSTVWSCECGVSSSIHLSTTF